MLRFKCFTLSIHKKDLPITSYSVEGLSKTLRLRGKMGAQGKDRSRGTFVGRRFANVFIAPGGIEATWTHPFDSAGAGRMESPFVENCS